MRMFGAVYFMFLGYLAHKYDVPRRIADAAKSGISVASRLAGSEFEIGRLEASIPGTLLDDLKK